MKSILMQKNQLELKYASSRAFLMIFLQEYTGLFVAAYFLYIIREQLNVFIGK